MQKRKTKSMEKHKKSIAIKMLVGFRNNRKKLKESFGPPHKSNTGLHHQLLVDKTDSQLCGALK